MYRMNFLALFYLFFCFRVIAVQTAVENKIPFTLRLPNSTETVEGRRTTHRTALILESRDYAGMFSDLDNVWAVLDCYEQGMCSAVRIDFGSTGAYYDPRRGPNWFNYYFLPIKLGEQRKLSLRTNRTAVEWLQEHHSFGNTPEEEFTTTDDPMRDYLAQHHPETPEFSRAQIAGLWNKYVRLQPDIRHEVQQFVLTNFDHDFTIGIHYRGTDKISEAPRTKYEIVTKEIHRQATLRGLSQFKIFVATDEQGFLDYIQTEFPNRVIYLSDTERSKNGKPLHLGKQERQYDIGKAALLDSLLLSKVNLLIRTSSNLSRWSTYFNPELPVVELSKRY